MDLDPGDRGGDGSGLQIIDDAPGRGPDQHDVAPEEGGIEFSGENVGGRDEPVAARHRVMEPHPAGSVGRYCQLPYADRRQSGLFAEALLGVCSRRPSDIAVRAESEPECLGSERRIRFVAEPHNQRHPANDVVPIGILVEEAISSGRRFQRRQV